MIEEYIQYLTEKSVFNEDINALKNDINTLGILRMNQSQNWINFLNNKNPFLQSSINFLIQYPTIRYAFSLMADLANTQDYMSSIMENISLLTPKKEDNTKLIFDSIITSDKFRDLLINIMQSKTISNYYSHQKNLTNSYHYFCNNVLPSIQNKIKSIIIYGQYPIGIPGFCIPYMRIIVNCRIILDGRKATNEEKEKVSHIYFTCSYLLAIFCY